MKRENKRVWGLEFKQEKIREGTHIIISFSFLSLTLIIDSSWNFVETNSSPINFFGAGFLSLSLSLSVDASL